MSAVRCPNCNEVFKIPFAYDAHLNKHIECPDCGWKGSTFSFEFMYDKEKHDAKSRRDAQGIVRRDD